MARPRLKMTERQLSATITAVERYTRHLFVTREPVRDANGALRHLQDELSRQVAKRLGWKKKP